MKARPLHIAASVNNVEAVNALLAAGGSVDATSDDGKTPLMAAGRAGRLGAVVGLIAAGADVDHADCTGGTAMMHAVLDDHGDVDSALMDAGADVNCRRMDEDTTVLDVAVSSAADGAYDILREALAIT
jgi:ankyrin repeat protein